MSSFDLSALDKDYVSEHSRSFVVSVKGFIGIFGEPRIKEVGGISSWRCRLEVPSSPEEIYLYILKENVKSDNLPSYCHLCRCNEWGKNLLSQSRYRFIIPRDHWEGPENGLLNLNNHLLHGMIHSSAYGHLISVNGKEGGSRCLRGKEIMDLWHRICTMIHVRAISVEDLSTKNNVQLRLLFGAGFGHPWFGKWGYKLRGLLPGMTRIDYDFYVNQIGNMEIKDILMDFEGTADYKDVKDMISYYNRWCPTDLTTLKELFGYMIMLTSPKKKLGVPEVADIADEPPEAGEGIQGGGILPGSNLNRDILFLYDAILGQPRSEKMRKATEVILGIRSLVKVWPLHTDNDDNSFRFTCEVITRDFNVKHLGLIVDLEESDRRATLGELKDTVQRILRETYCVLQNFVVEDIQGMDHLNDQTDLEGNVQNGTVIRVSGSGVDVSTEWRYEGGPGQ